MRGADVCEAEWCNTYTVCQRIYFNHMFVLTVFAHYADHTESRSRSCIMVVVSPVHVSISNSPWPSPSFLAGKLPYIITVYPHFGSLRCRSCACSILFSEWCLLIQLNAVYIITNLLDVGTRNAFNSEENINTNGDWRNYCLIRVERNLLPIFIHISFNIFQSQLQLYYSYFMCFFSFSPYFLQFYCSARFGYFLLFIS